MLITDNYIPFFQPSSDPDISMEITALETLENFWLEKADELRGEHKNAFKLHLYGQVETIRTLFEHMKRRGSTSLEIKEEAKKLLQNLQSEAVRFFYSNQNYQHEKGEVSFNLERTEARINETQLSFDSSIPAIHPANQEIADLFYEGMAATWLLAAPINIVGEVVSEVVDFGCHIHPVTENTCQRTAEKIKKIGDYLPESVSSALHRTVEHVEQAAANMEQTYGIPQENTLEFIENSAALVSSGVILKGANLIKKTSGKILKSSDKKLVENVLNTPSQPLVQQMERNLAEQAIPKKMATLLEIKQVSKQNVDIPNLIELKGTGLLLADTFLFECNYLQGSNLNILDLMGRLKKLAKEKGAKKLHVKAIYANEKLFHTLSKRYEVITQGETGAYHTLNIPLD